METFLVLLSMWGHNGLDWEYIGNQYVFNTPMTEVECTNIVKDTAWSKWESNEFYRIQIECVPNTKG